MTPFHRPADAHSAQAPGTTGPVTLEMPEPARKATRAMLAVAVFTVLQMLVALLSRFHGTSLFIWLLGLAAVLACARSFRSGGSWGRLLFSIIAAVSIVGGLLALSGGIALMGDSRQFTTVLQESGMTPAAFIISLMLTALSMVAFAYGLVNAWRKPVTAWIRHHREVSA